MKHWKYLSYVLRHKWFVFVAGIKVGAPIWRLVIHDWSKFLPCEWFPYVDEFYGEWRVREEKYTSDDLIHRRFDGAWNHHQKLNKHHWQYWLLTNDSDDPKHQSLQIPMGYVLEMVADWMGAGRAITGQWKCGEWYSKNRHKILLHDNTRLSVEHILFKRSFYVEPDAINVVSTLVETGTKAGSD